MLLALLSFAVSLGGPPAEATDEPPLVELRWQAPAECPDATAVHAAIASLVPEHPLHAETPPKVDAQIEGEASGFVLRLQLAAKSGTRTRELRARACASLADAVAMEVALLIEAEREAAIADDTARTTASDSTPTVPATTTPAPTPAATTSPKDEAPKRPHWRVRFGALVGARVVEGSLAAPTNGAPPVGRFWAGVLDHPPRPHGVVAVPERSDEGSRISLSTLTLAGCGRWGRGRFALAGCGGAELGVQWAKGIGLDGSRSTAEPSVAFVVTPKIEIVAHRLVVVSLGPWVRVSAVRPGVRVDGVGELYRAALWSFGGVLRLEIAIPGRNARRRGM
jgi:hypothetical protein